MGDERPRAIIDADRLVLHSERGRQSDFVQIV